MRSPLRRPGFVYILTNPAMPGLVKIGHTGRTPEIRAAELSASTGVAARFVVAWSYPVADHEACESLVHGRLASYRTNEHREFFRCSARQARRVIETEAAALLLPWWRAWLRRLLHPLPAPARPAWQRQARGDLFGFFAVLVGVGLAGLIVHYRPAMPAWLPASLTATAYALERLHQ